MVAVQLVPTIVAQMHGHGTTSFDGLAPDEAPDLLGGRADPFSFVALHDLLFVAVTTPIVRWLSVSWRSYAALVVFDEPLLLLMFGLLLFLSVRGPWSPFRRRPPEPVPDRLAQPFRRDRRNRDGADAAQHIVEPAQAPEQVGGRLGEVAPR